MAEKTGLYIGLGILGLLATFFMVEMFVPMNLGGGPVKQNAQGNANPGGYGSAGSQVAKTANQAANVMNTVTGDIAQVAPDINSILSNINSIGDDSFESFENEREGSDSFESMEGEQYKSIWG